LKRKEEKGSGKKEVKQRFGCGGSDDNDDNGGGVKSWSFARSEVGFVRGSRRKGSLDEQLDISLCSRV